MNILKTIGVWTLTIFFAMVVLAFFPSFTSLFAFLVVVLSLPIEKWQTILKKFIKGKWKTILIVILAILAIYNTPTTENESTSASIPAVTSPSVTTESPGETTTEPTTPTTEPATEPATEPSTEPVTQPATDPSTVAPAKPVHTHKYKDATCTSPEKCSCGDTRGKAKGHSWKDATCKAPKTCTVCDATSGKKASHKYVDGKCTYCAKTEPTPTPTQKPSSSTNNGDPDGDDAGGQTVYKTPTGKRYHIDPNCGGKNSKKTTLKDAKALGLTPCKTCVK